MHLLWLNVLFKIYQQEKIKEQERKLAEMQTLLREKEKAQEILAEELKNKEAEMKKQMEKQKVRFLFLEWKIFLFSVLFWISPSLFTCFLPRY